MGLEFDGTRRLLCRFGLLKPAKSHVFGCLAALLAAVSNFAADPFINFESPHVHPIDLSPSGKLVAVCSTAAGAVELFALGDGLPQAFHSIQVGMEPVSVRFRTETELWVANYISDSVSIVDVKRRCVVRTLHTLDEPADVVFAGNPQRAFVSCSQADTVLVYDPEHLEHAPKTAPIKGQRPRALAASPDGKTVYVAIFESGNGTTLVGGGSEESFGKAFPPNAVNDRRGPYGDHGRVNPPPNDGAEFNPPLNRAIRPPPTSGLIVRRDESGRWLDDNGKDWIRFVSGDLASRSGRMPGWQLIDHDLARIDAGSLAVSYDGGLMNLCMAIAVNPATGRITVAGTDARNELRFEPVLNGVFLRVQLAVVDPGMHSSRRVLDLNSHLTYRTNQVPPALRARSLGDPRGIAWMADGSRGLVTGMGSDNVVLIDSTGARMPADPIGVGAGPTGVVIDDGRRRAYVVNRFEGTLSSISLDSAREIGRVGFFDPTPASVQRGRKHLYNTHLGSGLGHVACGSCHVDGKMDRLAWDLGNPAGAMKSVKGGNLGAGVAGLDTGFEDYHPMKGPMLTQTLQDIVGKEPFHWRGDRRTLEEFNNTFTELQSASRGLSADEMDDFKAFLASLHFPPNPYRNADNSLPTNLKLPGHYTTGRFGPAGKPLPPGNAQAGLAIFQDAHRRIDRQAFACGTCHTLSTGLGADATLVQRSVTGPAFVPYPIGPSGERHHALVGINFSVQHNFKVPQLRNLYQRVGCEFTQGESLAGFGFVHDGGIDSLARLVGHDVFDVQSDAEIAHLVAFMLAFSGSDFPPSSMQSAPEYPMPPGPPSKDAPASLGRQFTVTGLSSDATAVQDFAGLADNGRLELIAFSGGEQRTVRWRYEGPDFRTEDGRPASVGDLMEFAAQRAPVTLMLVPRGGELASSSVSLPAGGGSKPAPHRAPQYRVTR